MKSINPTSIPKAVAKADGKTVGQCPACHEQGGDSRGEHLVVFPDGKYGCVANQGDKAHQKRIRELLGTNTVLSAVPRIVVRPYKAPASKVIQTFGRFGHPLLTLG